MVIHGVNKKQKKLLDVIWTFQDLKDLNGWIAGLNKKKQREAKLMKQLIILATIDERVAEMTEFPEVISLVKQFR